MPKTFQTYYLHFTAPLHLGDHRPDSYEQSESFLRSDTLMAAIYATWAKMGRVDWIPTEDNPPFVLSSAFPFWETKNNEKVHFFPRLMVSPPPVENQEYDSVLVKSLKKIKWLDQTYFERLLQLEATSQYGKNDKHLQDGFLSVTPLPKDGFMVKEMTERVTIPRDRMEEKDARPFYMERLRFLNGGLFFLAEGTHIDRLEQALHLLQHEGLGTDRNVGNGFFEWSKGQLTIQTPEQSNYATNLSLYCPESKEVLTKQLDEHSRFDFIKRGGWITTVGAQSIEKNSIYMFTEGSVFYKKAWVAGRGQIDITPNYCPLNHKIYRCGQAIFLPVNKQ